jgi:hypothetical protein
MTHHLHHQERGGGEQFNRAPAGVDHHPFQIGDVVAGKNLLKCWACLDDKGRETIALAVGKTFPELPLSNRENVIAALLELEAKRWRWLTMFPRALPPAFRAREAHATARKLMSCGGPHCPTA